jgi:hypothetical protein
VDWPRTAGLRPQGSTDKQRQKQAPTLPFWIWATRRFRKNSSNVWVICEPPTTARCGAVVRACVCVPSRKYPSSLSVIVKTGRKKGGAWPQQAGVRCFAQSKSRKEDISCGPFARWKSAAHNLNTWGRAIGQRLNDFSRQNGAARPLQILCSKRDDWSKRAARSKDRMAPQTHAASQTHSPATSRQRIFPQPFPD